ncbi:MAG: VWA domain-containing protein [Nanoarchaeota archaeon]|nr:VWA domain-containing protein [Nanoarchaeota archaeon]
MQIRGILEKMLLAVTLLVPSNLETTLAPNNQVQSGAAAPLKQNLDLPYDAIGASEDEEDAPEIISFYGQNFEGDAFLYVIDKSSSMRDSGELEIAKKEVIKNVAEFSPRVQFGIVDFDTNVQSYPNSNSLLDANPANKSNAISYINSIQGSQGSCCEEALLKGIRMINSSNSPRRVVNYVGDGGGTCKGANEAEYLQRSVKTVTSANFKRAQINSIQVLDSQNLNEEFLKNLASANKGTYVKIR